MRRVREISQGRWVEVLTRLGADVSLLDGKHRPCPACGGTDRFRFDNKDARGTHICSQCGAGDGFELVRKMFTYPSFEEAVQAVEEVLGIEGKPSSKEEQEVYRRKLAHERASHEKQEAEAHRKAADAAKHVWGASTPASDEHAYLTRKNVKAYGIRQQGAALVIPVRIGGKITSIQRIDPDSKKTFLTGGKISGGYYSICGDNPADMKRIIIAEGYATAATIREATGDSVAVAFNAGNLLPVAKAIRAKLPDIKIIIAGDNDESKTGEIKGRAAANAVGGRFIMPPDVGNDWNDYAAVYGLNAVAKAFRNIPDAEAVPEQSRHADIIRLSDVRPQAIRWLWPGRIALGKLTMIAGDPGLGKSLLTVELAAHVSRGKPWPVDGSQCPRGEVLLLSAEDDLADTIRPRMDAVGGDASRVYALPMVTTYSPDGKETKRVPSLVDDVERIGSILEKMPNIRLLTIDPVSAYLAGVDSHKNTDMRAVLSPWADLASRYCVAIVCISHLNKGAGSAMYRTAGSIAFMAAARAAFSVSKDKDDELRRLVLPVKNNLGPDEGGLAYRVGTKNGIPCIQWEPEVVTITAEDALSPDDGHRSATDEAIDWLREVLADGPMKAADVQKEARQAGISEKSLRTARERLGIKPKKQGGHFGKNAQCWMWQLPDDETLKMPTNAEGAHHNTRASSGGEGIFSENIHATETHTRQHINVARMDGVGAYGENINPESDPFDDQFPANDGRAVEVF